MLNWASQVLGTTQSIQAFMCSFFINRLLFSWVSNCFLKETTVCLICCSNITFNILYTSVLCCSQKELKEVQQSSPLVFILRERMIYYLVATNIEGILARQIQQVERSRQTCPHYWKQEGCKKFFLKKESFEFCFSLFVICLSFMNCGLFVFLGIASCR